MLDEIWKLHGTTACSDDEVSNLHSPSGGHPGEREREEGGGLEGGRCTKEVQELSWLSPSWEIVM
jgi:hypothetical protein